MFVLKTGLHGIYTNCVFSETTPEIESTVTEIEECLQLLLPRPESFFVSDSESVGFNNKPSTSVDRGTHGMQTSVLFTQQENLETNSTPVSGYANKKMITNNVSDSENSNLGHNLSAVDSTSNQNSSAEGEITENGSSLMCDITNEFTQSDSDCQLIQTDGARQNSDSVRLETNSFERCSGSATETKGDNSKEQEVEEMSDVEDSFVQEHGLFSRNYNISINVGPINPQIRETEENSDIFTTLRDSAHLVKNKYIPLVIEWLEVSFNIN